MIIVKLIEINGVRGFIDENGTAQLNLEDVSRGLGFTDNSKGTEYVKWDRVRQYLIDIKYSTEVSKDSYIPENIFYRLAFKAKNETADSFQSKVADEILPQIRKTGSYSVTPLYVLPQSMPEALRLLAAEMEEKAIVVAENAQLTIESAEQKQKLKEQEQPVAIYNLAIKAGNTLSMQEVAKSLGTGRTKLYDFLREKEIIMKNSTLPYQRYMDAGYFKVTERPRTSGDTIINDPATRVTAKGFDYIARLLTAN
jgi:phage antirepressor YoqD-like protein